MINIYTEDSIADRMDLADCETGLAKIISAKVREEKSILYLKLEEAQTGKVKWKDYVFNLGKQRNPPKPSFIITNPEVYLKFLQELGVDYNPYEDDGKYLIQLHGKELLIYKQDGENVTAVQPVKHEYSNAEFTLVTSRKDKATNENLHAYAMYNMGGGILRNEIAFTNNILNDPKEKYIVYAVKINNAEYDKHRGELKIEIEKVGYGSSYPFIFFNEDVINNFLRDNSAKNIADLKGKKLTALFTPNNDLRWLVTSFSAIKEDSLLKNLLLG